MTGALIQLVAKGIQDTFLTHDPQITYFKIVYRRYTNFSTEEIPQYFNYKPDFGRKITCTLTPSGDLVGNTYLVVTLPKIRQFLLVDGTPDPYTQFAWVKKIGYALIKKIEIEIGGEIIDRQYGEWLNIANELFNKKTNRSTDIMIGNVDELTSFSQTKDSYKLYVPLKFWFCKNYSLALPILCLHHSQVKINLELNDLENCYILSPTNYIEINENVIGFNKYEYIYQTVDGTTATGIFTNYDPLTKRLYYMRISRKKFVSPSSTSSFNINNQYLIKSRTTDSFCTPQENVIVYSYNVANIQNITLQDCHLLVNYVYLDIDERNRFIQNKNEYLIEQVQIFNPQTIMTSYFNAKIDSINPTRYITWVVQPIYYLDLNNNDYFNYTDDYMYYKDNNKINNKYTLNGKNIIESENILFNGGYERLSPRTSKYFNYTQPLQHFEVSVSEGINVYSYALYPAEFQPSGSCNSSYIGYTELSMKLASFVNENNPVIFRGYAVSNNILRIIDGLSGLVFVR